MKGLSTKFKARYIHLIIFVCLFCACSKTQHQVTPTPDEPPLNWSPNSLNDVRKLHIVPSLGFLTSGSTQYVSKLKFDKWFSRQNTKTDLGEAISQGEAVNLITVGGGLTAGAQCGGLFRDGQLSAYPNLVAKQMGMPDFKTPLFDEAHSNGTGFTLINEDKSQTFFKVINNLGTIREEENGKPLQFSPFAGQVNNYSAPWLETLGIFDSIWDEKFIGKAVNSNGVSWPAFLPYLARFIHIRHFSDSTLFNYITDYQTYNFFILESNAEEFFNNIRLKGSRTMGLSDFIGDIQTGENYTLKAIQKFKRNGSNGVIFTVPHFRDLGIASWGEEVMREEELKQYETAVDITNQHIREWAKSNRLAVVELDVLYNDVIQGRIKIGKNIAVSGKFDGNFFSSDGVYPSTLGQAIIANEVIKAINLQFKSKIQPVDIEKYLVSIGFAIK